MIRVFDGSVCRDFAPDEGTPEGALVALKPLGDPNVNSGLADPMNLPPALAYLDGSLGLAVAAAPAPDQEIAATAFAEWDAPPVMRLGVAGGGAPGAQSGALSDGGLSDGGLTYLAAGIEG